MIYAFGAYTLDTNLYELRHAGKLCPLEPHAVDILAYLLRHRERVVSKQELLEQLWPDRFVGEGILAQRLMMIRKAIGDDGRNQHCIKTLHGRGYRFAAGVSVHADVSRRPDLPAAAAPDNSAGPPGAATAQTSHSAALSGESKREATPHRAPPLFSHPAHFVGRDAEMGQLAEWWVWARRGVRQVGLIVGEAGIGKTALVDAFVAHVAATEDVWVGRGQCMDHYGMGEPYLPVLEALGRLCRDADRDRFLSCLRQYAPSWLAHLPAPLAPADKGAPAPDATAARMLRELTDALEVLTATRPLVLVLEDLHWSDRATLAWLAYLARRHDPARMLILGTYRPGEVPDHAQPLHPPPGALAPHAQCSELRLDTLSACAVAVYLSQRCSVPMLPASLPHLIHQHTSGHPLFLVTMVDELIRQRRIEAFADTANQDDLASLREFVPTNLRQYIEEQFERLSELDQALLGAASAAGDTFAVAAAAAGVEQPSAKIEARYAALVHQGRFLRTSGAEVWPDGTMTTCYRFKHALYQEVVYKRMPADRQIQLHRQIGARKEAGYGTQAPTIAAELAVHFARGGDARRAVYYLHCAAENALHRSAYQEAIRHLEQGLEALPALPDAPERTQHKLRFLTTLGLALVATKGQAHADVQRTYTSARTICHHLGAHAQLFQVLLGLFSFHVVRAQLSGAWDVCQQLLALAERLPNASLRMVTHLALGQTSLFQGALGAARVHLEQGIALYEPEEHHGLSASAGFPGDLGVFCRCFAAHTLWHLGYPDQALQQIHQARALAEQLAHPFSRALVLAYAAMLYQFRREAHRAHESAEALVALCRSQGFPYYLAWGTIMQGWARTAIRPSEEGIAQMRDGIAAMRTTGAALRRPYYLALLADAYARTGQTETGLTMLAEGLAEAHLHGECWHEAELHRLQGELSSDGKAVHFQRALDIARQQQARSLELRAAMSLARVWHTMGKRVAAQRLLAPIHAWFTEGFDTADLQDAKLLLDDLR